jgi:Rrf2 family cysteine metabolism transcriptional repressor
MELALRHNECPIQIKDVADSHGIPQHYLEQILVQLKKAGIVESFRGAQGGYALARRPGEIRVADVLAQLDGRLAVVPDARRDGALSFFWASLESQITILLDLSIEELILRKQKFEGLLSYNI